MGPSRGVSVVAPTGHYSNPSKGNELSTLSRLVRALLDRADDRACPTPTSLTSNRRSHCLMTRAASESTDTGSYRLKSGNSVSARVRWLGPNLSTTAGRARPLATRATTMRTGCHSHPPPFHAHEVSPEGELAVARREPIRVTHVTSQSRELSFPTIYRSSCSASPGSDFAPDIAWRSR